MEENRDVLGVCLKNENNANTQTNANSSRIRFFPKIESFACFRQMGCVESNHLGVSESLMDANINH